jgi:hypothetical protein
MGAMSDEPADARTAEATVPHEPPRQPDWWHRDHPTFTTLSGFFSGLAYVALVPAAFTGLVTWWFGERTAYEAFMFVLVLMALPLFLVALPSTQRFGKYMLLGMAVTALVVVGVSWMTWLLLYRGGAA